MLSRPRIKRLLGRSIGLLAIAVTLAGCPGEKKTFDPAAGRSLTTIVLPPAGQPAVYAAMSANPLYVLFGIPGALIGNEVEKEIHGVPFTEAERSKGIDLGAAFTSVMKDDLTKAGYRVEVVAAPTSRPDPNGFFTDYKAFATPSGAPVLDLAIVSAGYRGTLVLPYRPFMQVIARLVDPTTGATLYANRLEVDPATAGTLGFRIVARPDPSCFFENQADLTANAQKAGDCLGATASTIAHAITQDLHK